jgi:hypothetical protein
MRTVAGIENRVVFQDDHGGLNGIERRATSFQDAPTGDQCAFATRFAGLNRGIRNIPRATMNDQCWFHLRIQDGKAMAVCKRTETLNVPKG